MSIPGSARTGNFGPLVALDYCPACNLAPLILRSGHLRCGVCKLEFEPDPTPKRDLVPDVLASRNGIDVSEIHEKLGIHVCVFLGKSMRSIVPGDVLDLEFILQNCWDSERTIAPVISPERRSFFPQRAVAFESDPMARMTLAAGEVGRLRVPLVVTQRAGGKYRLHWSIRISGIGGRRIRRTKREHLADVMPASHSLIALLLTGVLLMDSGCYLELDVEPGEGASTVSPPFSSEILWKPE